MVFGAIDHRAFMLLGVAPKPFASPEWAWEIKYDGYRVLGFRGGASARLMSRGGRDISAAFPEVVDALRRLRRDAVIDGELTVRDADGRPDFHLLRPRAMMTSPVQIRAAVKRTISCRLSRRFAAVIAEMKASEHPSSATTAAASS